MTSLAGQRILIAEDEAIIALQLEQLLVEIGCEIVGPISRVADVLSCIKNEKLDGALLDVNLRGESILPSLPLLIQLGLPFVITSGYDAASLFPAELRQVPRVTKPFDETQLKRLCIEMFAKR
jgi:two-component SAPR family response regulator